MVQDHGVGPDVLEQQRLDEVHAQSISACQAMRRDVLRDVRVRAEVVSFSSRRAILRTRITISDGLKRPCKCGEMYTPDL